MIEWPKGHSTHTFSDDAVTTLACWCFGNVLPANTSHWATMSKTTAWLLRYHTYMVPSTEFILPPSYYITSIVADLKGLGQRGNIILLHRLQ
jgi:hypothetical protein